MKTAVIGSFVVDLMARTPHLPEVGETVKGSFFHLGAGGKGFNQAVAARRAGADVVFSTKLGRDEFGNVAFSALEREGLGLDYVFTTDDAQTGAALISVDEGTGKNEIVVVTGACDTFGDAEIEKLERALDGCGYLLLQLEINVDALVKTVDLAYERGIRVVLNPAPVQELPRDIYKKLWLVTPNEVEAAIITGCPCDGDCRAAAGAFFELGVKNVIITLGDRGVYVNDGGREGYMKNHGVRAVDTTGAGDAFNGALLAALGEEKGLFDAAVFASLGANLSVTRLGTSDSCPVRGEIDEFSRKVGAAEWQPSAM